MPTAAPSTASDLDNGYEDDWRSPQKSAADGGGPRAFRDALGQFATGVCVITALGPDGPIGLTANSFSSVSLEPPLVLWSVGLETPSATIFARSQRFGISLLSADQEDVALHFARSGVDKFQDDLTIAENGLPFVKNAAARFDCETRFVYPGGDHDIIVGEVIRFSGGDTSHLVFHRGRFLSL
ncbi:MAG: flavin reductase family protein [Pseudomonadota bacterium]